MPIYLKCSYGYLAYNGSYSSIPVENLFITDPNRYFILPDNPGDFAGGNKTPEQFINAASACLGDQFYILSLYEKFVYTDPNTRYGINKYANTWFPSAPYWAPNLVTAYQHDYEKAIGCIIFNDGELVIAGSDLFRKSGSNYVYGGTRGVSGAADQDVSIPCLMGPYTSGMDLTTANFGYLTCTTNSQGSRSSSFVANHNSTTLRWREIFQTVTPAGPPSSDPYDQGGTSEGGIGGTGTFSETGDTIGIPGLPTLSAVDTGFITLFNPSAAQVKALANYMWSASFDLATFKNIVANPIDCILGLTIVPVDPPNAGSKVVSVGNIPTDVTLPYLSSQYVEVDCGTLNVQEFWGSYLDYSPYTKMSLYLPYIGIIPLDIDDVMNASIAVKYHVDVLSGACVAYVLCNGTQLYTYVGQCSSNVPITSNDFTNTVNGILGIAGSIGKLAADGGASAPTEAAGIAANAINALKPNIQKSGAMSGTGGMMGVQTPYLICQRPRQSVPAYQNEFTGYPANITAKLSDLSGYTEVDSIHLDGLTATQEEQQEIMDLLTSGVII